MSRAWTEITVAGEPKTQGSKRAFVHRSTGRAIVLDDKRPELHTWRTAIAQEARQAMAGQAPLMGPVVMRATFLLHRPSSAPKRRRTWPMRARSLDLDKLLRAAFDALCGVVYVDDAQVVQLDRLGKDYAVDGWTGAVIAWRELP